MSFELVKLDTALPEWRQPDSLDGAAAAITALGRNLHEHAYLIGKTLTWVKAAVGHGKFLAWVEENVWFTRRTATNFMAFAAACDEQPVPVAYAPGKRETISHLPPEGDPEPIIPEVVGDDERPEPTDDHDAGVPDEPGPVVRKGLSYAGRRRALRHCRGLRTVLDQEIGLWNVDLIRRDVDTLLGMLEATD